MERNVVSASVPSLRRIVLSAALIAACALTACNPGVTPAPSLSPSLTPTALFATHVGTIIRATLPPTWTPTPSPLPTRTFTATPITPTATETPAPTLNSLCESFQFVSGFADGHLFQSSDTLEIIYGTPISAVRDPDTGALVPLIVRFLATHPRSGENLGVQLDGGQIFGMELPVDQLPHPGFYTWRLAVSGDGIADQCVHTGYFFVAGANATTPESAPTY